MDRPYFDAPVDQLEQLLRDHKTSRVVLKQVRDELQYRRTARAKQLMREIDGILDGRVPLEQKAPRPPRSDDQTSLLDPE